VGSLRGYDYKEFAGNRYFLTNIDYYWNFSGDFATALFADLGQYGFGEKQFQTIGLKTDVGIGLMFEDLFRLDIAQRLDDTGKGPVVTGRFEWGF
jgi:outer membrane translocation and assembly module TamA